MKCFINYKSDAAVDVKDLRLGPIVFVELEEVAIGIGHLRVIQEFLKNCEIFVRSDFFSIRHVKLILSCSTLFGGTNFV
jgi:hypothetical protein